MDHAHRAQPSSPRSASPASSPRGTENRWAAVLLVAASTFVVVAAEMMPVGLLTPMGSSLQVSGGTVGLSLTITGLVAAATAPFVPAVAGRSDRKTVLVVLMALVALANALTAVAPTFAVVACARVVLGAGMGAVWALAASLAPQLVERRSVGAATTLVFSGIAVASVLGVPVGTFVGGVVGWRASFWGLAAAAALVSAAMVVVLPPMRPEAHPALGRVSSVLRRRGVASGLVLTVFLVTAHFAAYTYVRPALERLVGLDDSQIGTMLVVYGVLGVVGTFAVGPVAVRVPKPVCTVLALGVAATLVVLPLVGTWSLVVVAALVGVWGLSYGGVSVSTQSWMAAAAPADRELTSALWVAVFNASIALGALGGGQVYDRAGPTSVFWVAAGFAAVALVVASVSAPRQAAETPGRPV